MPNNINLFDTYYMAGMVQEMVPQMTFFRDRYFPTGAGDIFANDKVLVEYRDGDRRLAPFVVPRVGDIPIGRIGYEVHEYEPPHILPSRLLTMDDLTKRGFGEALFSGSTQAERARLLQLQDLTDLDQRITRREEWMAVQTMINNGCTMTAYIDNTTIGQTDDVFYYDTTGSNPAIYTVGDEWDDTLGDFWGDVEAMCGLLADRGLAVADLLLGTTAANFVLSDEVIAKKLDNRRMEFGQIAPRITTPGVAWLGRLNFSGFELDIFSIRETYVDNAGVTQRFFPAKSAMVTAPNCGHMMYAQISQIEPDEQFHTFAMRRVPKFVVDRDKDTRKLRLGARPLAAPLQKSPWIYAADVVK
ncbi:MAG: major capsid protein [Syntrophobacter sp.]